ncbi:MAG TPA: hypothetical protein PLL10_00030 [Elusimicrobiales bacterium]|nr:hypothetical protein [Elusimicrobiales bacterium]
MKKGAEKWTAALQKKGLKIEEKPEDVEVVKRWSGGFRMVKLVGKRAYDREGALMRHCVASYYGKDDEIYSLRDKDNVPHATLSRSSQQIKGKGNGSIHPKYVKYVVEFLEHLKIEVRDSEMQNLGYVNIEKIEDKEAVFPKKYLFRDKYFFKECVDKIVDKDGKPYENITLWGAFGLFEFTSNMKVKFNFNVANCVERFKAMFRNTKDKKTQSGGYGATQSGGYGATQSGGDYAKQVGGNCAKQVGGNCAKQVGGDGATQSGGYGAKQSGGDGAKQSGGYCATQSGGDCAKQSGGDGATQSGGDYATQSGGYGATQSGGDYAKQSGGDGATQSGGYCATQSGGDCATQSGGYCATQSGGYGATQSGGDYATQSGGDCAKQSGGDCAKQSGGDYATQSGGERSIMAAGQESTQTMLGTNCLALSGKGSKVRGVKGSWIILTEWDGNDNIISVHPRMVDGVQIKEMVFYTLKDGRFVEAN